MGLAKALVGELPETMAMLTLGRISEEVAVAVCAGTATLTLPDRRLADARLAPDLAPLTARQARKAADRVAAELDAAAVVRARERAARARRVTIRPAPGGIAYLTVLGPLAEMVSAFAALGRDAGAILAGHGDQDPAGRSKTQIMADLASQRLTGLAPGEPVPMEIYLVMPAGALFDPDVVDSAQPLRTGQGDKSFYRTPPHADPADAEDRPADDRDLDGLGLDLDDLDPWDNSTDWARPDAPAEVVGFGPVPARLVRDWLRQGTHPGDDHPPARVWLRRLFTSHDGRDLIAMDSRRRFFTGALRQFVLLRDQHTCTMAFCDAPSRHLDHTTPVAAGGTTTATDGVAGCARHNLDKEAGWQVTVTNDGLNGHGPHTRQVRTPTGATFETHAPPIAGIGTHHPPPGSAYYLGDQESLLARWQHHLDEGRPLDRDEQLHYDHLRDLFDNEPPYLHPAELADL